MAKDQLNDYSYLYSDRFRQFGFYLIDLYGRFCSNKKTEIRNKEFVEKIEDLIGDTYDESNRNLSQITGIDLKTFGYSSN